MDLLFESVILGLVVAEGGFVVGEFLAEFELQFVDILFVTSVDVLSLSQFIGESLDFLAEEGRFVLDFGVFGFKLVVLSVETVESLFVVSNFTAGVHLILLGDGDFLFPDLSSQIVNIDFPLSQLLPESLCFLRDYGVLVLVLVDFPLQQFHLPHSPQQLLVLPLQ